MLGRWGEAFALAAAGLVFACLPGCSESPRMEAQDAVRMGPVVAASGPMAFIAQRVAQGVEAEGGALIEVEVLIPQGASPETWFPDLLAVGRLQEAGLIVLNGAGFEPWADHAALPRSTTVRTANAAGIELLRGEGVVHSHGVDGDHAHAARNAYTWLDPTLLARQAGAVRDALKRVRPEAAEMLDANAAELERELVSLAEAWASVDVSGVELVARSERYAYLAAVMGWAVDVVGDGEVPAGAVVLDDVIDTGAAHEPEAYLGLMQDNVAALSAACRAARGG